MTVFPTALDNPSTTNPSANTPENQPGQEHDVLHSNHNDQIAALQAKVGINASGDPTCIDFKLSNLVVKASGSPVALLPAMAMQFYVDISAAPTYGVWLWIATTLTPSVTGTWIQIV